MAKSRPTAAPGRSFLWLQGAVCGAIVVMAPGTALVATTLLAACLAMFAFEQTAGRPITRSMLLMGAATALSPLQHLWAHGGSLDAAIDVLSDPMVPLWSWVASGSAWLIGQLWEVVSVFVMQKSDDHTSHRLQEERAKLLEEWRNTR